MSGLRAAGAILGLITVTAVGACGGSSSRGAGPATGVGKVAAVARPSAELHERIVPRVCPARSKLAELLGHTAAPAAAPPPDEDDDSAPPPSTSVTTGQARIPANQAYRAIAPATVLVRTDHGLGTGIVIDPRGYVLTNHHVIAEGRKQDFVITVNVTFGDLSRTGRMNRQEKVYEAVVVKSDVVRDMAVLKLTTPPPPKLEVAKLARSIPQVAEKVIAVGHAGIGFLWAAKTCTVASVGERQQDVSMLAAFDCTRLDPSSTPAETEARKARCDEQKKKITDALMSSTQGLAIQTDCAITRGDSGGPLVNAVGEVVGLNQSIAADVATVSFHVHLDEIREFIAKLPEAGVPLLPDPYCDGGLDPTLEDLDLDGVEDTLVNKGSVGALGGYDRLSLLIDLDQDHATKKGGAADTFEAEVALLTVRDTTYVWYDTDADARFDVLLVDKDGDGTPEQLYRLGADGQAREEKDKEALPKHDLSAKLVKDRALQLRLAKIASAIGATKLVSQRSLAAASEAVSMPDPQLGSGTNGRVADGDGNGRPDVAAMQSTFARAMLIDADENSLGSLKVGDAAGTLLKAGKVDVELSVIVQGSVAWAMYDTDDDGKTDLALMSSQGSDPASLITTRAWRVNAQREMSAAPEHVGRRLLRPGLLPAYPRVTRVLRAVSSDVAADEALGSLPDPFTTKGRFRTRELKDVKASSVVEAQSAASTVMLVDVDHDSKLPEKDVDLQKAVAEGKFDVEVAVVHRGDSDRGADWVYYDTDGDGALDLVLFVPGAVHAPTHAYRVTKGPAGSAPTMALDTSAIGGKPMRHSVFKDKKIGDRWKAIAGKLFKPASIED